MRQQLSRWLQYIYFLRFCILTWLFLPVLIFLDATGKTTSITRGIFTMESGWQAYNAAFFVLALNMTVLITARNIVRNGSARFISQAPDLVDSALCSTGPLAMWLVLIVVHLPTILTVGWLYRLARHEEVIKKFPYIGFNLLAGLGFGMIFWLLVSIFYYWTYRSVAARKNPSALIFPESPNGLFSRISELKPPRVRWLYDWMLPLLKLSCSGYADAPGGPLWELHFFSTVSLLGFFLLYVFLYPATAPIPRHMSFYILGVAAVVLLISFLRVIFSAPLTGSLSRNIRILFVLVAFALFLSFFWFNLGPDGPANRLEFAFPALASIMVITTFSLWFLAGLSFFLDRYRVSVVVFTSLLIFLPKLVSSTSGEHYYAVKSLKAPVTAPTPAEVFSMRATAPDEPYIIVTASGGGIHAAAWTAQVMYKLETAFANDPSLARRSSPYTFHDHLLLASGVSGGSVGLMPFLLEYQLPSGAFTSAGLDKRITLPPACSSLEAVAWGLAYYDLYRLLLSPLPTPWPGNEGPDRSWALAEAFNRNLRDINCSTGDTILRLEKDGGNIDGDNVGLNNAADLLRQGKMPAFTFNTTSEETGGRFLLSDYNVPSPPPLPDRRENDFIPSESFLHVYAQDKECGPEKLACIKQAKERCEQNGEDCTKPVDECNNQEKACQKLGFADLPLATAARLSATFPYVSSGTRIPLAYARHAYHFLDGGYFDNDGTASVIEFLKSALDKPDSATHVRKILLIEIRDGADLSPESEDSEFNQATRASDWTIGAQITAPPKGLWNAGHVSIAKRNRRELCLLEQGFPQVEIHHIVFPIYTLKNEQQPLSWKLTPRQLRRINEWVDSGDTSQPVPQLKIKDSIDWIKAILDPQGPGAAALNQLSDREGRCSVFP
ncbi:hypothetical protein [Edaphobacter aggregans]|uniref:hypothetical protein n=1 Tax=Edaphobacter aggregans TaxID=570835 RepID=UPI00054D08FB|nr:hypothetical protein [Edaphobacter aggregans]